MKSGDACVCWNNREVASGKLAEKAALLEDAFDTRVITSLLSWQACRRVQWRSEK